MYGTTEVKQSDELDDDECINLPFIVEHNSNFTVLRQKTAKGSDIRLLSGINKEFGRFFKNRKNLINIHLSNTEKS